MEAWLSFSLTPVQGFIEAARTVRDLKVGSDLLSYLVGQAYDAALRAMGTALYPQPSGTCHNLPNRFVVRYETLAQAKAARELTLKAFDRAWGSLTGQVKQLLDAKWGKGWDDGWDQQVQTFWDARILVLEPGAWSDDAYRALFDVEPGEPRPDPLTVGWKVTSAALAGAKAVRHVPPDQGIGRHKCTMMGDLEQMGPGGPIGAQRAWWQEVAGTTERGIRVGERDRLCAVALVKRFAPADAKSPLRHLQAKVPDTASIAIARWLKDVRDANLGNPLDLFIQKADTLAQ